MLFSPVSRAGVTDKARDPGVEGEEIAGIGLQRKCSCVEALARGRGISGFEVPPPKRILVTLAVGKWTVLMKFAP